MRCEAFSARFANWTMRLVVRRTGDWDREPAARSEVREAADECRSGQGSPRQATRDGGCCGTAAFPSSRTTVSAGGGARAAPLLQRLLAGDGARLVSGSRRSGHSGDPLAGRQTYERHDDLRGLRPVAHCGVTTRWAATLGVYRRGLMLLPSPRPTPHPSACIQGWCPIPTTTQPSSFTMRLTGKPGWWSCTAIPQTELMSCTRIVVRHR
jgi:hypothetical protein